MSDFGKQWQQYGGIHCNYAALHTTKPKLINSMDNGKIVPKQCFTLPKQCAILCAYFNLTGAQQCLCSFSLLPLL